MPKLRNFLANAHKYLTQRHFSYYDVVILYGIIFIAFVI